MRGRKARLGFGEGPDEEDWWTAVGGSGAVHPVLQGGAVRGVPWFTSALCWHRAPCVLVTGKVHEPVPLPALRG